jgi:8-oxo-dGTP pyrophosphatase MutT (NUDIX family)
MNPEESLIRKLFRPDVGVHLILIAKDRVLLAQRANTGFADGQWSAPGGHLEDGESLPAGVIREAQEELGITIQADHLRFAHLSHHLDVDGQGRLGAFFVATHWTGALVNAEPGKCEGIAWFSLADLPENTVNYVRTAIADCKRQCVFSTHGW